MPRDSTIEPGSALLKVCAKHGWAAFTDDFVGLFQATTTESLARNVRLLEKLCSINVRKKDEGIPLCRVLAQELVSALEGIDRERRAQWYPDATEWEEERRWPEEPKDSEVLSGLARSLLLLEQESLLARLVTHVLATPKVYPLIPVHVQALTQLQPWLQKHVKKPSAALSRWLDALRKHLESLTPVMPREPADFRREANHSCPCRDCAELARFLKDPQEKVYRFSAAQERRRHLENVIRNDRCDLDLTTVRQGSPHTLVCTKNTASFQRKLKKYYKDKAYLAIILSIQENLPGGE